MNQPCFGILIERNTDELYLGRSPADQCAVGRALMYESEDGTITTSMSERTERCTIACLTPMRRLVMIEQQPDFVRCICPLLYSFAGNVQYLEEKHSVVHPQVLVYKHQMVVRTKAYKLTTIYDFSGNTPCNWGLASPNERSETIGVFVCKKGLSLPTPQFRLPNLPNINAARVIDWFICLLIFIIVDRMGHGFLGLIITVLMAIYVPIMADTCSMQGFVDVMSHVTTNGTHEIYRGNFLVRPGYCTSLGGHTLITFNKIVVERQYDRVGVIPLRKRVDCVQFDWNCPMTSSLACTQPRVSCKKECEKDGDFFFEKCESQKTWSGDTCFSSGATETHVDTCISTGKKSVDYFGLYSLIETSRKIKILMTYKRGAKEYQAELLSTELNVITDLDIRGIEIQPVLPTFYSQVITHTDGERCSMLGTYPEKYCPGAYEKDKFVPFNRECLRPEFDWQEGHYVVKNYENNGQDYFSNSFVECPADVEIVNPLEWEESLTATYNLKSALLTLTATVPIKVNKEHTYCKNMSGLIEKYTPGIRSYYKHTVVTVRQIADEECVFKIIVSPCSVSGSAEAAISKGKVVSFFVLCGISTPSKIDLVGETLSSRLVKESFSRDLDYTVFNKFVNTINFGNNITSTLGEWWNSVQKAMPEFMKVTSSWFVTSRLMTIVIALVFGYFAFQAVLSGAYIVAGVLIAVGAVWLLPNVKACDPSDIILTTTCFGARCYGYMVFWNILESVVDWQQFLFVAGAILSVSLGGLVACFWYTLCSYFTSQSNLFYVLWINLVLRV